MKHRSVNARTTIHPRRKERTQMIGVSYAPALGKNLALAATALFALVALTLGLLPASPALAQTAPGGTLDANTLPAPGPTKTFMLLAIWIKNILPKPKPSPQ